MARPSARTLIESIAPNSFQSWDSRRDDTGVDDEYRALLERAETKSGVDESVITGDALVHGRRVAIAVSEFSFMGGTLGRTSALRVTHALDRAALEGLPFIGVVASGGTRMQEGTAAFVLMRDIASAMQRHRDLGLPSLVVLRHPTFGGALATWGSLATFTIAEKGASMGLLGPRVHQTLTGKPLPTDVQTAAAYHAHGLVDEVASLDDVPARIAEFLDVVASPDEPRSELLPEAPVEQSATAIAADVEPRTETESPFTNGSPQDVTDMLARSGSTSRIGIRDLLMQLTDPVVWLRGTDARTAGASILCIARISGIRTVVIGQDRHADDPSYQARDLQLAQDGIALAEELDFPILTVTDTRGVEMSAAAERSGIARELARTLAAMGTRTVPAVSLLLGEGRGAAAVATLGGDRILACESAWLAALPLEAAADILYRDESLVAEAGFAQRIGAAELFADGVVDRLIAEPADRGKAELASRIISICGDELTKLVSNSSIRNSNNHRMEHYLG